MKVKSILTIIIFFATIFISSCNKDSFNHRSDIAQLSNATKQALSAGNLTAIKQSYSLLSKEEKQLLWGTKLNAILNNDKDKLTNEQRAIINSIKLLAGNKNFMNLMKDPTDGEVFIKNNLTYFQRHFDNAQLYMLIECPFFCENFSIFESIEYLNKKDKSLASVMYEVEVTDEVGGDEGTYAASKCKCYYSIYCSIAGDSKCITGGCQKVQDCGLFGTSNCTGNCNGLL